MEESKDSNGTEIKGTSRRPDNKQGDAENSRNKIELDDWQREVLETQGNICLRSGRQVGKSLIISIKASEYAIRSPKKSVLIVSHTERQAYLLFSRVRDYLLDNYKQFIKKPYSRNITKSEIKLNNNTIIRCLPCGLDGTTIRGYTVDMLIVDEAAHVPDDVFNAISPTLASTKGVLILLSTPKGVGNFFYNSYHNPDFKTFHISSEDCPRISKEFLEQEKKVKTKLVYAQEYLGEFTDNLRQLFPDELIKSHMTLKRSLNREGNFFMGVDVARMGGDECTFEIFKKNKDELNQTENFTTANILIPDTINRIIDFNLEYKELQKIYIDTGGMGVAVFDFLLRKDETKRKVVAIDNATRPIERDNWDKEPRKRRLLKEQLYMNLKLLLEQDKIWLLDDEDIFFSLKSVQVETDDKGDIKIFGTYTHIAEGIIRAAWSSQEKINKLWVDYF